MPKPGWSLPICIGKVPYSWSDHTETLPLALAGKCKHTRTTLFLLKIALNKGLLNFRQLLRKSEHFVTHSFGLPANISISFRKVPWVCAVRHEIPPFPAGKEIVSGIQRLTQVSHKGSLQAHMEPCTASQQCVSLTFPVQPVFTNTDCFTSPPYLCCFLAGEWWRMYSEQDAAPRQ